MNLRWTDYVYTLKTQIKERHHAEFHQVAAKDLCVYKCNTLENVADFKPGYADPLGGNKTVEDVFGEWSDYSKTYLIIQAPGERRSFDWANRL